LIFVIALVISGQGLYHAANAAGVVGTHGTLTVESCWERASSTNRFRRHTECGGTFRSDDGKIVDDEATIRAKMKKGSKVSVQRLSKGGAGDRYVQARFAVMTGCFAWFFLGWLVLAYGMSFAATGMFPRSVRQAALITRVISGTRVGKVRKWVVRSSLAGAGVCLALTWLTW
jgi:hypothetical protein